MAVSYLHSVIKQFEYYKSLGDKAMAQVSEADIHKLLHADGNSLAILVKHMAGNMLSRWTHFLTEDGEKSWRQRDAEFEDTFNSKSEMLDAWEQGWTCLFDAIRPLRADQLEQIIYIRNDGHTVVEAINRQLCHYAYHVGQIVMLAKAIAGDQWRSLSIPKGKSSFYNTKKFDQEKTRRHFTDEL